MSTLCASSSQSAKVDSLTPWKQRLIELLQKKQIVSLSSLKKLVKDFPNTSSVKATLKPHPEFVVEQNKSDWIVKLNELQQDIEEKSWKQQLIKLLEAKEKVSLSGLKKDIADIPKGSVKATLQSHPEFVVEKVGSEWVVRLKPQQQQKADEKTAIESKTTAPIDLRTELRDALHGLHSYIYAKPKYRIKVTEIGDFYKKFPEYKQVLKPSKKGSFLQSIRVSSGFQISDDFIYANKIEGAQSEKQDATQSPPRSTLPPTTEMKKEKRRASKKQTVASLKSKEFAGWTSKENVNEKDIRALLAWDVDINKFASANVNEMTDEGDKKQILNLKARLGTKRFNAVLREVQKGVAYRRVDHLWKPEGKEQVQELLDSGMSLKEMADELRTTTTQLAYALCGKNLLHEKLSQIGAETASQEDEEVHEKDDEDVRKNELAEAAIALAKHDYLTGVTLSSFDHDPMEEEKRDFGKPGEQYVYELLEKLEIEYKTEEAQLEDFGSGDSDKTCTPDVLLVNDDELINGHKVKWIEVKHAVCIPGVSPQEYVDNILSQVNKYVDAYGTGMLVFSKDVLASSMLDACPEGVVMMRCPGPSTKKKKADKPRFKRGVYHGVPRVDPFYKATDRFKFDSHPSLMYSNLGSIPVADYAVWMRGHYEGGQVGRLQADSNTIETSFTFNPRVAHDNKDEQPITETATAPIRIKVKLDHCQAESLFRFSADATLATLVNRIEQEMRLHVLQPRQYRLSTVGVDSDKEFIQPSDMEQSLEALKLNRAKIIQTCYS
eukprot:m.344019 g.344019  ORF g.344019 m.344019 type:complete len:777 (+) comp23719_c0_seq1:335-2665(+)